MTQINSDIFKVAVDNAPVHIIITDTSGKIIYANFAAFAITGYSVSEMIGKTPALWGGQMPKEFYNEFWKTLNVDKKTFFGQITNRRKDGETYTAKVTVTPLMDEHGEITGFVGIEEDISAVNRVRDVLNNS